MYSLDMTCFLLLRCLFVGSMPFHNHDCGNAYPSKQLLTKYSTAVLKVSDSNELDVKVKMYPTISVSHCLIWSF